MASMDFDTRRSRFGTLAGMICALILAASPSSAATYDFDTLLDNDPVEDTERLSIPLSTEIGPVEGVLLKSATADFLAGQFDSAARKATEFTKYAPQAAEGWHLLGLIAANKNSFEDAVILLEKAGGLYSNNADPFVTQGEILLMLTRVQDAKAAFQTAVEKDPSNWRSREALARQAEREGNLADAATYLSEALDLVPANRIATRINLSRVYLRDGQPAKAEPILQAFIDENPDNVRAHTAIGRIQIASGRSELAVASFQTASDLLPNDPNLRALVAVAQASNGKLSEATETLTAALSEFPEVPNLYAELGKLQGAQRLYDEAAKSYEQGLSLAPDNPKLIKGASFVAFRKGQTSQAAELATKLANRPNAPVGDILWLATMSEADGNSSAAIENYERVLKVAPDTWLAMNNLAALITDTNPARAVELAGKAADLSPETTQIKDTLGWAHFKAGNFDEARALFEPLLANSPENASLSYKMGETLLASGEAEKGRKLIEDALRIDPSFRYATQARQRLENL